MHQWQRSKWSECLLKKNSLFLCIPFAAFSHILTINYIHTNVLGVKCQVTFSLCKFEGKYQITVWQQLGELLLG